MSAYPDALRDEVERYLADLRFPSAAPQTAGLEEAMRYSLLAGGKRIRPVLALATARAIGRDPKTFLPLAASLELIHTYSLIHDDLPAMDDDALRRGRPTCHVKFGEDVAILAGDALYAEACEATAAQSSTRPAAASGDRSPVRSCSAARSRRATSASRVVVSTSLIGAPHSRRSRATRRPGCR